MYFHRILLATLALGSVASANPVPKIENGGPNRALEHVKRDGTLDSYACEAQLSGISCSIQNPGLRLNTCCSVGLAFVVAGGIVGSIGAFLYWTAMNHERWSRVVGGEDGSQNNTHHAKRAEEQAKLLEEINQFLTEQGGFKALTDGNSTTVAQAIAIEPGRGVLFGEVDPTETGKSKRHPQPWGAHYVWANVWWYNSDPPISKGGAEAAIRRASEELRNRGMAAGGFDLRNPCNWNDKIADFSLIETNDRNHVDQFSMWDKNPF
ncbi:hypothetical protein SpCBS45565_g02089 [Spizellomyces sp. 'palustris']|nr:hypothetical protein SpCBS45565_g02089 [Spizellomyces sp. 'palustris']